MSVPSVQLEIRLSHECIAESLQLPLAGLMRLCFFSALTCTCSILIKDWPAPQWELIGAGLQPQKEPIDNGRRECKRSPGASSLSGSVPETE